MDRHLLTAAVLALIFEVLVLLADLQMLPLWQEGKATRQMTSIGEVTRTWQNVRRKGNDSIVWDRSQAQDEVYENDSILTLAQSSAIVKLKGDIQIRIGENTLVVLEPMTQVAGDHSLKLKFSRGGFHAKSPKQGLTVDHQEWTMQAQAGTELNVQQTPDGQVDVEVLKGHASIQTPTGETQLTEGTQIQVQGDQVGSPQKLDNELTWDATKDLRVYTDQDHVATTVQWKGSAHEVQWIRPDGTRESKPLTDDQRSLELVLPLGTTHLALINSVGRSRSLAFSVWPTPLIYHYTPLPRDRIRTGQDVLFGWTQESSTVRYRWELASDSQFTQMVASETIERNQCKKNMSMEGAFFWRVVGIDEEGFEVMPSRPAPLYSVPDPLAPPQLKKPELRKPASPSRHNGFLQKPAWKLPTLWQWLIETAAATEAEAERAWEAEFSWQPVPGADHYVIEVSESPDFRDPFINTRSKKTSFVWKKARLGRYYWRVAAGQGQRLGLFSEVSEIRLNEDLLDGEQNESVVLRPQPKPAPPFKTNTPAPAPPIEPTPAPPLPEAKTSEDTAWMKWRQWHGELSVGAGFVSSKIEASDDVLAGLTGTTPPQYRLRLFAPQFSGDRLELQADSSRMKWVQAKSSAFQPDLVTDQWLIQAKYGLKDHNWNIGLEARSEAELQRVGVEQVDLQQQWMYGPVGEFQTRIFERNQLRAAASFDVGSSAWLFEARSEWNYHWNSAFFTGLEGLWSRRQSLSTRATTLNLRVNLGWSW